MEFNFLRFTQMSEMEMISYTNRFALNGPVRQLWIWMLEIVAAFRLTLKIPIPLLKRIETDLDSEILGKSPSTSIEEFIHVTPGWSGWSDGSKSSDVPTTPLSASKEDPD